MLVLWEHGGMTEGELGKSYISIPVLMKPGVVVIIVACVLLASSHGYTKLSVSDRSRSSDC